MWVGSGKITLDFYNNSDLNEKREQIEKLCTDLRKKFNLSALEVDAFDELEKCVIGFAAVIPENWKTQSAKTFLEKVCKTIDETAFARVTTEDVELLAHGGGEYELEERS